MGNTYQVGDLVRIEMVFTDGDNVAQDPDTVYGYFKNPDATVTTYEYGTDTELVRDAAGKYHFDVDVDPALTTPNGTWYYRFYGEASGGASQAAAEGFFTVEESSVV